MAKISILKNLSGVVKEYNGQRIAIGAQSDISGREEAFRDSDALLTDIGSGGIVVNDGVSDLDALHGRSWIMNDLDYGGVVVFTNLGAMLIPIGSTAERPVVPIDGMMRYNTTLNHLEVYENGSWSPPGQIDYIWSTLNADTGSASATLVDDTLAINGSGGIATDITGKTLTIDGSGISNPGSSGLGEWSEIFEFGDSSSVRNKFLKSSGTNHTSLDSTTIALAAGEVVHVTISTEEDATNNWFVQIITNAIKGGVGTYGGGTQIGANIEKPTAVLDKVYTDLTGYSFAAGDRIAVYVAEGTLGSKDAVEPLVRVYVRYT
jgi:hypothetical protein